MAALSSPRCRLGTSGVVYNTNLSFEIHVSSICKTKFFHLQNISKLHQMLSIKNAEQLFMRS